ncbi:hypothetical protein LUZ63_010809 [Rhynchospora breviuscula]|uniref:DNA ligase n=1 Tax=Rhynchospora breviuscula TaxID=2022672 RepID=A0A9Q0CHM7_9POAL|nr:hypothetical protein LUZ63_010809 [Rhynchospora breviuscula]
MFLIRSPPLSFSLFLRCQRASLHTPFSKTLNSTYVPPLGLSASAAMSSSAGKRSINDVLMGNARAAAAAKKSNKGAPSSSSSQTKKVKTLEQCFGAKEKSKEEPPISDKPEEMAVEKAENVKREEMAVEEDKDLVVEAELKGALKKKVNSMESGNSSSPKKPKTLAACSKSNNAQEKTLKPCKEEKKTQDQDAETDPVDEKKASLELKKKGENFDPKKAAFWKPGEPVPFRFLAYALDLISNESGRIVITEILSNVFRTVMATTPGDLLATVYLAANRIAPPHEGIELGIGDAALIKALGEAYGRNDDQVKKQLKELGDLGLVAKMSRSSQGRMLSYFGNSQKKKSQNLTITKVLDTFRTIAKESGKDSQNKKREHIKALLVAATDCEPQYIIRLLQSKMRIGLAEKTVLVALAQASVYSEKSSKNQASLDEAAGIIKQVYSVLPIYDKIVPELLKVGVLKLQEACDFSLGVPVGPMLAKPTKAVSEILDKFQGTEFTCEYKYDGERAQIHCMEDGTVEIYSRNAERNTGKYPDVVNAVSRFKKPTVKTFVLDCEIVAYDQEKHRILPFQVLSTRARKGVVISDIKVTVCTFGFDILYLNGQPLLQEPLKVRREHLYSSFEEIPGIFQFATAITSHDLEEIQKFLETAVNSSCEGLIIKTMDKDATYEPAKRSNNWLKLKKDYMDSVGDSLDLVPIAAFHGRGKRTGVYGSFLLACYDEQNEEYQTICNIGTGFSEAQLEERSASLRSKVISKPKAYYRYADTMNPDVWFEPSEVWEVKAADLSISPVHRAANGIVDPNKGISLRFPRLLRVRDDKNPEQATTSDQVADMYRAQKINHANDNDDEDDD